MTTPNPFTALVAAADGVVESFATDLHVHDKARLDGDDAPRVFGWIVGTCGTHLLDPRCSPETLRTFRACFNPDTGSSRHSTHRFHFWNGRKLETLKGHDLFDRLDDENRELAA